MPLQIRCFSKVAPTGSSWTLQHRLRPAEAEAEAEAVQLPLLQQLVGMQLPQVKLRYRCSADVKCVSLLTCCKSYSKFEPIASISLESVHVTTATRFFLIGWMFCAPHNRDVGKHFKHAQIESDAQTPNCGMILR